jgi:hypothetical protein
MATSGGSEESALRPLLEDFQAGRIDRRTLIKKALAAGASAVAVYGAIGETVAAEAQIPAEGSARVPAEGSDPLNAKGLQKITAEMIAAITSAPFVAAMRRLQLTPLNERLDLAPQLLMPDILRKKGVKLPADMRITSRYFERGSPSVIEVNDYGAFLTSTPLDPVAAGLGPLDAKNVAAGVCGCGCAGGLTFCGGAGGGVTWLEQPVAPF